MGINLQYERKMRENYIDYVWRGNNSNIDLMYPKFVKDVKSLADTKYYDKFSAAVAIALSNWKSD